MLLASLKLLLELCQAKKTGREPSANDATELERVTQEQAGLQKQLESYRKQVKQHQMQTQDYRTKKRVRQTGKFTVTLLASQVPVYIRCMCKQWLIRGGC